MREHMSGASHKHERHQRMTGGNNNFLNSNHSIGWAQQQVSPAMSHHVNHPNQLPIQSRNSVNSHTTGSTSSSHNQPSPQDRQVSIGELKSEMEVWCNVCLISLSDYCRLRGGMLTHRLFVRLYIVQSLSLPVF